MAPLIEYRHALTGALLVRKVGLSSFVVIPILAKGLAPATSAIGLSEFTPAARGILCARTLKSIVANKEAFTCRPRRSASPPPYC